MAHGHNPNIRVGNYVFVPDDLGVYNLWLIVAKDDLPQFPKFYILKVNLLLKWYVGHDEVPLFEGKHVDTGTYFSWAVQRTQNSYNSGVWASDNSTVVENQQKAILPTNDDTHTITYNEHFIISDNPLRRTAWEVSKVIDSTIRGITHLTFKQELEFDDVDNLSWINQTSNNYSSTQTGANYDFYCPRTNDKLNHNPVSPSQVSTSIITYSGANPVLKIGGNYKTFTANLYHNGAFVQNRPLWTLQYYNGQTLVFTMNFIYVNNQLTCDNQSGLFHVVDGNTITYPATGDPQFGIKFAHDVSKPMDLKIKCLSILDMVGKTITLTADDDPGVTATAPASITLEVKGL